MLDLVLMKRESASLMTFFILPSPIPLLPASQPAIHEFTVGCTLLLETIMLNEEKISKKRKVKMEKLLSDKFRRLITRFLLVPMHKKDS